MFEAKLTNFRLGHVQVRYVSQYQKVFFSWPAPVAAAQWRREANWTESSPRAGTFLGATDFLEFLGAVHGAVGIHILECHEGTMNLS